MKVTTLIPEVTACRLWEGCSLQVSFQYGGLTEAMILEKIQAYERCDDLTPGERELLAALNLQLAD